MSNFQAFKKYQELYTQFSTAEKYAKTQPNNSVRELRRSLEAFLKWLKFKELSDDKEKPIYSMIIRLLEAGVITEKEASKFHEVRKTANKASHYANDKFGNIKIFNSKESIHLLKTFHQGVCSIMLRLENVDLGKFDEDILPIADLIPVKKLDYKISEACAGKYLAERRNENNEVISKSIIRQFKKSEVNLHFTSRDVFVLEKRWGGNNKTPTNIVKYNSIYVEETNDIFFSSFDISDKFYTLTEFVDKYPERLKEKREELISDIINGIKELHTNYDPIIHRVLSPDSIYIFEYLDGAIEAKICNFEYSKVENPKNLSVNIQAYEKAQRAELDLDFIAPEVRELRETTTKSDIYSLGKIILKVYDIPLNIGNPKRLVSYGLNKYLCKLLVKMIKKAPKLRPDILEIDKIFKERIVNGRR